MTTGADDRTRSHRWDMSASGPRLLVMWDGGSLARPLAPGDKIVLGRADDCTVQVFHASVSRRHVELVYGPPMTVRDLGSSHGTRIAGRLVPSGSVAELGFGEPVDFGAAVLIVHPGEADAPTAPSDGADAMERVRQLVRLAAPSHVPILLLGETGVGKDVTAAAIVAQSPRRDGPFVRVNCAAITESLLESELFGHERGAFTGAVASKPGLVEQAHGGTLLLDEIGELPLALQAKLLRVLEDHEVRRVGATKPRSIDIRVVAATNRDLSAEVARGSFRRDLYFRLNGLSIRIPPLRERKSEIGALADCFLEDAARRAGAPRKTLSPSASRALVAYRFPGNVRELRNVVERAMLLAPGATIEPEHLVFEPEPSAPGATTSAAAPDSGLLPAELQRVERERIEVALEQTNGNQTLAAKVLGITRRQLIGRLETYGMPRPRKKGPGERA